MLRINNKHLVPFANSAKPNLDWDGSEPRAWCRNFVSSDILETIPQTKFTRSALRQFCQNRQISAEVAAIACMAWGGMNRQHGKDWWADRERWLPIIREMREGIHSRKDAYTRFHTAKIEGLGPAYYTKLIYFMRPNADGYIMDQWTGKSISLLFEASIIRIRSDGWIMPANDALIYESYCSAVEELREKIFIFSNITTKDAGEVEAMLFSKGGRHPWEWRRYVKENWRST